MQTGKTRKAVTVTRNCLFSSLWLTNEGLGEGRVILNASTVPSQVAKNWVSQLELLNRSAKEGGMALFLWNNAISTKPALFREKGAVNWTKQNVHTMHIKDYDSFWSTVKTIENPNSCTITPLQQTIYYSLEMEIRSRPLYRRLSDLVLQK